MYATNLMRYSAYPPLIWLLQASVSRSGQTALAGLVDSACNSNSSSSKCRVELACSAQLKPLLVPLLSFQQQQQQQQQRQQD
jgi:hypothetical protein